MRIAIICSRRFLRIAMDMASHMTFKPFVHIYSFDEDLEISAKKLGADFSKLKSISDIYSHEELENFDVAVVGVDDDATGIAIVRALKTMNIPTVVLVLNNSMNMDIAEREGVRNVVAVDEYVVGNVLSLIALDTWIYMRVLSSIDLWIAVHRVARRGGIGVPLRELVESVGRFSVKLFVLNKLGRIVENSDYEIDHGDTVVIVGSGSDIHRAVNSVEAVFRKHEEVLARRYTEMFRYTARPHG